MRQVMKDVGDIWICKIPATWDFLAIKNIASHNDESLTENTNEDYLIRYIDISSVNNFGLITNIELLKFGNSPSRARRIVRKNDVIISTVRTYLKAIAKIDTDYSNTIVSTGFTVLRSRRDVIHEDYLYYLLYSDYFTCKVELFSEGISYPAITSSKLVNIKVPLPPVIVQLKIVDYLDQQCVLIDHQIALQEEMIAELQAYKQSLITEAVTKGLNPDVPMKESGMDSVGMIPCSWHTVNLKRFGRIWYGLGEPPQLHDEGLPIIRATNIERGKIAAENLIYALPSDIPGNKDVILKNGDIIIVRSGAYAGDVGYINEKWAGSIAGYDMIFRATKADAKFLKYAMLSPYVLFDQFYQLRERSAQPHLNANDVGSAIVIIPNTLEEQQEIALYLDDVCASIDSMITIKKEKISVLMEYKQSLIYECVTGKRDCTREEICT